MNLNPSNAKTAVLVAENGTTEALSASATVNKKSTKVKAAQPASKGGKAPSTPQGKTEASTAWSASAARRGRPPLSEHEKQERQDKLQNRRTVVSIINTSLARQAKTAKRGASNSTSRKSTGKESMSELTATQPTAATPSGADRAVAQRHLGVDYGEADGVVVDQAPRRAQRLPENVKKFIIIRNACGQTPREVIRDVQKTFGLQLTSSQVARYDPTKTAGQTLRDDYKRLFAEMRHEHSTISDMIGIGSPGFRIVTLHHQLTKAVEEGDAKLALRLLIQAAREKGEGYYAKGRGRGAAPTQKQLDLREKLRTCRPEDLPPIMRPDAIARPEAELGGEL
jgi:hypothetical protein